MKERCLRCGVKRTKPDSYFCTDKCGHAWAVERVGESDEMFWCEECGEWYNEDYAAAPTLCPHRQHENE